MRQITQPIPALCVLILVSGCGIKKSSDPHDPDFRRDRAIALGDRRDATSLEELSKLCLEDPDALVRGEAAAALGRSQSVSATPILLRALEDSNAMVRREAAGALGVNGDRDAIPALLMVLGRSSGAQAEPSPVRRCAARSLGELGDPGSVPGLIAALEDPDGSVRHAAHLSLQKITGQNLSDDPEEWRRPR